MTISSDPFARRFAERTARKQGALVVYITAGHPDFSRSLELLRGIADAGADVVEVGVPFSDPLADGPVIQASSQRALDGGMTLDRSLELISRAELTVPTVLFTYLNPLLAAGDDALERAASAGVQGILITDLPLGADPALEERIANGPLAYIRLVAPTTPERRMADIALHGSGFVYLISRMGVTGVREDVSPELPATIARLRSATDLPICVGFGISTPSQAASVVRLADGAVVGSAVVRAADSSVSEAVELVGALRTAIDAARLQGR